MKAQWQIIDLETGKAISVGEEFELVDFMKRYFDNEEAMSMEEAGLLFGDPTAIKNPIGILNASQT